MEESTLDYALGYAKLSWAVLPCHWITDPGVCSCAKVDCKSPGKHPLIKNGVNGATKDPKIIGGWFKKWPKANIGVATGAVSGILALDVDPKNGGFDSLDKIISENEPVPDNVLAVTGSGGRHYVFKYPGKVGRSTTGLWPGIDIRGDGGYIVAAPSGHISGKCYFWDAEADPLNGAVLQDTPTWIIKKLSERPSGATNSPVAGKVWPPGEVRRIRAALTCIPGFDERDRWLSIGMALKSSGAEEQAFSEWCSWSSQSDKYDLKDQRRVWESIKVDGGVALGSLFAIAKQHGWVAPEPVRPPMPPLSVYVDELAMMRPVKAQRSREELESLINATDDFDVLTERLPVEIYNSGLARPAVDLLLGQIAKKARVPKSALLEVVDPKANSHTKSGKADSTMLALLQRYVFLKNSNRIYDTETRIEISREGFDGAFMHLITDEKPSVVFLSDPEAIKVDGLIYLPGKDENPIRRGGSVFWNLWRNPGVSLPEEALKEDVEPWLEHLHYLYPNKDEQCHILNWIAFVLQNPGVKINHALLLAGTSRVGKDMLLNPIRYGIGEANVCEPPASELKESYTDYLHHSKLVIFQEIQNFDGLNLENKLKPILADPPGMLRVRLFGRGFYESPNIVQAIFMSNYKDALHISEGDGRYFAVWTDALPLEPEYYTNLAGWLEGGGNGLVVRWLLDRDLSNFNPKQPAGLTQFKEALLQTSKSPLRHQLEDMIAACDYPFNVDCVRSADIAKVLRDKYSSKAIGSVLGEIGCIQSLCRRGHGDREKVSLYAVRNMRNWQTAQPKDWLIEYDSRSVKSDASLDPLF